MTEQTLQTQHTQSFQDFERDVEKSLASGDYIDPEATTTRQIRRRALELLDRIPKTVIFATSNPTKINMYLPSLENTKSNDFNIMMSLINVEDWNTWLRTVSSDIEIPEPEEPYETAHGNVMAKLVGYVEGLHNRYSRWNKGYPGVIFAVDDDFEITDENFKKEDERAGQYQPKGGIKKIEGERVSDHEAIALKYSEAVDKLGKERDLTKYGLGKNTKSLPVVFEYYLAAAVGKNDDNSEVDIYTHQLKVPGYLIQYSDEQYNEDYPVIWVPAIEGVNGKSMGVIVKKARGSKGNRDTLNLIIGQNIDRLKGLIGKKDTSGWQRADS